MYGPHDARCPGIPAPHVTSSFKIFIINLLRTFLFVPLPIERASISNLARNAKCNGIRRKKSRWHWLKDFLTGLHNQDVLIVFDR